jgi:16S rRNA (cytosine967-C5)-methyltransferase
MVSPKNAREAALLALLEIDTKNAYAQQARDRILDSGDLAMRDRAFCTELIYGVTKHKKTLDHIIEIFSTRPTKKMDPVTRNALRLGVYQILYLEEIPRHAAVNESVALAKEWAHSGSAGFVNAILRSIAREPGAIKFPDPVSEPVSYISLRYSHPEWLVSRWTKRFGTEETIRLCQANNERAPVTIRINTLKIKRDMLLHELTHAGIDACPSQLVEEGIELKNGGDLFCHRLYSDGMFLAQDTASMLVAYALSPRPDECVLDLAAAPGGKSTHIAQLMDDRGQIIACDVHEHRLDLIRENLERLGISSVKVIHSDSRCLPAEIRAIEFDKVLLDTPCSGTGVLRRRADLRWQRVEQDLTHLITLQKELLEAAAGQVKPGGVLVYSTCSLEPEENLDVISDFLSNHPEFSLDDIQPYLPKGFKIAFPEQGKPYVNTYPHIHKIDGFFIARMKRHFITV